MRDGWQVKRNYIRAGIKMKPRFDTLEVPKAVENRACGLRRSRRIRDRGMAGQVLRSTTRAFRQAPVDTWHGALADRQVFLVKLGQAAWLAHVTCSSTLCHVCAGVQPGH